MALDDPLVLQLAKSGPALFMQRYRPPMLIDEIQFAPELLSYIKMETGAMSGAMLGTWIVCERLKR